MNAFDHSLKKMRSFRLSVFLPASILIVISVMTIILLLPHHYHVPAFSPRKGTLYWDLPSGSRIGYTFLPARGEKKPFPVIFLQGGPGSPVSDQNIMLLDTLAGHGYDVYLYDQLGCGHSSRLKNIRHYTAMQHAIDLEEIVDQTGAAKVILIGQSWGTILATLFMADNESKVEKAVFTSPGPIIPINKSLAGIAAPDTIHLTKPVHSNRDANRKVNNLRTSLVRFFALKFGIKIASDSEMDAYQTLLDHELSRSTVCDTSIHRPFVPGGGYYAQLMTVNSFGTVGDPRPKLKDCRVPVLILKGDCDNQPWGYITEYFSLFPEHRFVFFHNAGHSISTEQPALYLNTITGFLNEKSHRE